jgi:ferredoxin
MARPSRGRGRPAMRLPELAPRHRSPRLAVDRIRCDGRGLCAELLPELIDLDDWGYPIIRESAIPPSLETLARRAVASCPVLALRIELPNAA